MANYLFQATYREEGAQGLQKEGGTARRAAVKAMIERLGGTLQCFYFTFGKTDAVVIAELPDHVSAATASIAINASGSVQLTTTVLLTPEAIDEAVKKTVGYRPPGT